MKSKMEIEKKLNELITETFRRTSSTKITATVAWVQALEWVLEDQEDVIQKRYNEIKGKPGTSDGSPKK